MAELNNKDWFLMDGDGETDILDFTSLLELNVESGGAVASQVLEQGSFAAYNKTQEPLKITATVAIEGESADLQAALGTLNELKEETKQFSLVTPEFDYVFLTLESFSYARKREEGRGVLYVQMNLVEVREVETAMTSVKVSLPRRKCKSADCASQANNGKGQTQEIEDQSILLKVGAAASTDINNYANGTGGANAQATD